MDFKSACHYVKAGYRVRRDAWEPKTYMTADSCGELSIVFEHIGYTVGEEITEHRYMMGFPNIEIKDVLADDWEIITTGIRKHFGRYGMEYDDDTDWDNYVPTKGGWDFDDEDDS